MKTIDIKSWKVITVVTLLMITSLPARATLLVRYTFDEATSGTTDALNVGGSLGAAANGVFSGTATRTTSTPANFSSAAMSITPVSGAPADIVGPATDLNGLEGLSALTVTMWLNVQANTATNFRPLVGDIPTGGGADGWIFYYSPNATDTDQRLGLEVGPTLSVDLTATHAIHATNNWVFIAATWDGATGTTKFYSGSPTLAVSQLGTNFTMLATMGGNTIPLRVAGYGNDNVVGPYGFIDDVRIYDNVLGFSELTSVWLAGFSIPEPSSLMLMLLGGATLWRYRSTKRGQSRNQKEKGANAMKLRMFVLIVGAILSGTVASQATLLVRYTFDEATSGTTPALDVGGSAGPTADGGFNGNTTRTTSTPNNFSTAALSVSQVSPGNVDYVGPTTDINAFDALPAMTVTMWLNVQGAGNPGGGGFIPLTGDISGTAELILYYNSISPTQQQLGLEVDAIASTASANINAVGAWTFVAAAWDGTNVRFYAGSTNSAVSLLATAALSTAMTDNSALMRVGTYTPSTLGLTAFIDDFRVYSTELNLGQLSAIQLENLQVPEPSSVVLMLLGGGALWRYRRSTKRG